VLVRTQRVTLIPRLSSYRSTLRPRSFLLIDTPCPLLRLMFALLAALHLGPHPKNTTALPSCHRSSPKELYDCEERHVQELAVK
jgi:hypothetical protein